MVGTPLPWPWPHSSERLRQKDDAAEVACSPSFEPSSAAAAVLFLEQVEVVEGARFRWAIFEELPFHWKSLAEAPPLQRAPQPDRRQLRQPLALHRMTGGAEAELPARSKGPAWRLPQTHLLA